MDERNKRIAAILAILAVIVLAVILLIPTDYSIEAGEHGTVEPNGGVSLRFWEEAELTAVPDNGYRAVVTLDGKAFDGKVLKGSILGGSHTVKITFELISATHTLTVRTSEGGSSVPSGTSVLDHGTTKRVEIFPEEGYNISDVKLDGTSLGPRDHLDVVIDMDHVVDISFAKKVYQKLTVEVSGDGIVDPLGETLVEKGTVQRITAQPSEGLIIDSVKIDGKDVGVQNIIDLLMDKDHHVRITFAKPHGDTVDVEVSVDVEISASVSLGFVPDPVSGGPFRVSPSGTMTVPVGGSITIVVDSLDPGCSILWITVDGSQIEIKDRMHESVSLENITADVAVEIGIQRNPMITADSGEGGSVEPEGGTLVVPGGSAAYTIKADADHVIGSVYVDGRDLGELESYTFTDVMEDHVISASFRSSTHSVTVKAGTGGTVTPSGTVQVADMGSITFTISPSSGYTLKDLLLDGTSVKKDVQGNSYTLKDVMTDHTVEASFSSNPGPGPTPTTYYNLTVTQPEHGSITPSTSRYESGTSVTVRAQADPDYKVTSLVVDGTVVQSSSYDIRMDRDHTVSAVIAAVPSYTVTFSGDEHTSVSVTSADFPEGTVLTASGSVLSGGGRTISAQSSDGYVFDGWYSGDSKISSITVGSAMMVSARSVQQMHDLTISAENGLIDGAASKVLSLAHNTAIVPGDEVLTVGGTEIHSAASSASYEFSGWYTDSGKVETPITLTSDLEIKAVYSEISTLDHIEAVVTKDCFSVGEEFDMGDNLKVYAYYIGTADPVVITGYTLSQPDMSTSGEKTVTISYTESGKTEEADFMILVCSDSDFTVKVTSYDGQPADVDLPEFSFGMDNITPGTVHIASIRMTNAIPEDLDIVIAVSGLSEEDSQKAIASQLTLKFEYGQETWEGTVAEIVESGTIYSGVFQASSYGDCTLTLKFPNSPENNKAIGQTIDFGFSVEAFAKEVGE